MHGDVMAANILVAPHESVSIIDFESAEVVSDSTKSEMLESENAEVERLLNDLISGR
jgi:RIO-like serine/threonine protein kinase